MFVCFYLQLEIAFPAPPEWQGTTGASSCFHGFCRGCLHFGAGARAASLCLRPEEDEGRAAGRGYPQPPEQASPVLLNPAR